MAVHEFFSCVASLMSLQLRSLVVDSLQDVLYIFTLHQVRLLDYTFSFLCSLSILFFGLNPSDLFPLTPQCGNDFGEEFDEVKYVHSQLLLVELQVSEPCIEFFPSFSEIWDLLHRVFMEIIKSAEELPRVSLYCSEWSS